ncbi:MAG TPA: hypothetical protein VLM44_00785 [Lutibacter sp.]|nr:hypothetical protein [Lutibacter sp.]
MKFIKSHFRYTKSQRNGIFFLLILIVFLQGIFFFVDFSSDEIIVVSNLETLLFKSDTELQKLFI